MSKQALDAFKAKLRDDESLRAEMKRGRDQVDRIHQLRLAESTKLLSAK